MKSSNFPLSTYYSNKYHCDALGSPRKMTDESGAVTWTGAYQPFGEMIVGCGNVHGFTPLESIRLLTGQAGKELDAETGLNYFCLRYYDPQIGRFMTLDPFDGYIELPQTQNRYAYCMNNPLKYIDPLGLDEDEVKVWGTYPNYYLSTITVWGKKPTNWFSTLPWSVQMDLLGYGDVADIGRLGFIESSFEELVTLNLGNPGFENARYPFAEYYPEQKNSGGTSGNNIYVGIQFQAQATFLWWGMSWGQTYILFPAEQRGWYFFMEPNRGFGLGIALGPIVAWGGGPLTGEMADFTFGGGPLVGSIFDNGLMRAIFFGYSYGVPITVSSGLMTTVHMDSLKWP